LWIGAAPVDIHVVLATSSGDSRRPRPVRAYLVDCFAVCGGHQHAVMAPNRFCRNETVLLHMNYYMLPQIMLDKREES